MNAGIITSYIVAGMILLSMAMLTIRVNTSSAEITLTQVTRERVSAISDMLYDDLPNMGYDIDNPTPEIIVEADSFKIQFYRKIDRHNTGTPEKITWEFTEEPVTQTPNPDDRILRRTVEVNGTVTDVTDITLGVTNFQIWYFDEFGLSTLPEDEEYLVYPVTGTDLNRIKQLYISLEVQSPEQITHFGGRGGRYIRSVWEKRFSPGNLKKTN